MANRSKADTETLDTQIYRLIVKGLTTEEISTELKIPLRTIQTHTKNLMNKVKAELINTRQEEVLADIQIAKSRFLEDKKILRRILDDPRATHRAITEAVRTDAELNISLLKIGVEGIMFNNLALQSKQSQQYERKLLFDREAKILRLDPGNVQLTATTASNNKLAPTDGIS